MTDTEMLNFIERYKLNISYGSRLKVYYIRGEFGEVKSESIRKAVCLAMDAQFDISVKND